MRTRHHSKSRKDSLCVARDDAEWTNTRDQ